MSTYRTRLATALLVLVAGCQSSGTAGHAAPLPTNGTTVSTALLAFTPGTVHISRGQTVTWIGGDNITHVLVEGTYRVGGDGLRTSQTDDHAFRLQLTSKGQAVSHTYDTAGTFTYYCTIHFGMNGTVVVS